MRTGPRTLEFARKLRGDMSPPEVMLWARLRQQAGGTPRFRRQHPLGPYIADFFCPKAKLVIEIDGWSHNMGDQPARDERRDLWMASRGYRVVRYPVSEVLADADAVTDSTVRMATALNEPTPSRRVSAPSPLPRSAGEDR